MAPSQAQPNRAASVPRPVDGRYRTSVDLVTLGGIPSPRAKTIACRLCGHEVPRWQRHATVGRTSGMWLLIAHQLEAHGGAGA